MSSPSRETARARVAARLLDSLVRRHRSLTPAEPHGVLHAELITAEVAHELALARSAPADSGRPDADPARPRRRCPMTTPEPDPTVPAQQRRAWSEDWLATVLGLALLAFVLLGALPGWLVP